jgi:hypothetical protein
MENLNKIGLVFSALFSTFIFQKTSCSLPTPSKLDYYSTSNLSLSLSSLALSLLSVLLCRKLMAQVTQPSTRPPLPSKSLSHSSVPGSMASRITTNSGTPRSPFTSLTSSPSASMRYASPLSPSISMKSSHALYTSASQCFYSDSMCCASVVVDGAEKLWIGAVQF